jgi:acyl carrier protein
LFFRESTVIEELEKLVMQAAREIAAEQGIAADRELTREARLFGEGGLLDSLALVSLVVAVEQAVADRYGKSVSLADEKALSQRNSPYRSVATLAAYAVAELEARPAHG